MLVSVIVPVKYLGRYCGRPFEVCYADIVLASSTYRDFYYTLRSSGQIVVMDQSPLLPRRPISEEDFLTAISLVKPDIIMLPNIEFSSEKTIAASREFLSGYKDRSRQVTAGVLQGYNLTELGKCYKALRETCEIIGLPSSNEKVLNRGDLIDRLGITEPVIYLEVHRDPFREFPRHSNVVGIGTSLPIRLAYELRVLSEFLPSPKPLGFFTTEDLIPELADKNIKDLLGLLEG